MYNYFLIISAACVICVLWCARRADQRELDRAFALDLGMVIMICGFLGGRALHVLYEEPHFYFNHPIEILRFWHGGFVFFGGAFAATAGAAALIGLKNRRMDHAERHRFAAWADFFAPICALGYALGRVACWVSGCCFGRICELPSGATFRFPTQVFAVCTELTIIALLLIFESRRTTLAKSPGLAWTKFAGAEFVLWILLHATGRVAMEAFRADDRGLQPFGFSLSTWISLALALAAFAWIALQDTSKKA